MLAVPKFSFPPLYPQKRSQNCGVLGSIVASCFGNFGILGKVRTEEEKKKKKKEKEKRRVVGGLGGGSGGVGLQEKGEGKGKKSTLRATVFFF